MVPVQAAENNDNFELSPEQLFNATVVSVSKTSEKLMDAPAAVYVLSNEDIMRSGATSVPEALRLVPGVQVARVNASVWAVSVRGFNGTLDNKLLVLLDGREIYDPLFSGVYWDIQDVMLEDVDRIEVIRGPGASLWGANAVNGVINIITKKAQDTQGNLVSLSAGNQERAIAEERFGGKLGDSGYYRIYGKYFNRDSEKTITGMDANDGQTMGHGGFRADWKNETSGRDDFTVEGDAYHSDASQYRKMPIFNTSTTLLTEEDLFAHGGNILGRWNRKLSSDSNFTVQSYVDYTARDQILIGDRRVTYDIDAQYELPSLGRHKIITGLGYRYSDDELSGTQFVTFTNFGENTRRYSSFIQDKITLMPKSWFLTLGSKFEHNDYTGFEFEPDARLQWSIDDKQMAWASASRAVRTPSRLEEDLHIVQAAAPGVSLDTLGNPNLNSEKLLDYEIGYRRQITSAASLDLATFYSDYHGLSTFVFDGFAAGTNPARLIFAFIPTNATAAETYGGEATADWRVSDKWKLSASYSLLNMNLFGDDHVVALGAEDAENQSPHHMANLRSQWDVTKDVSWDTMLYYVSGVSNFDVGDYARLDMRLGWRIADGLQFNLVGQDLLDRAHHEFIAPNDSHVLAIDISRSVYGNLTWRY
jgi:iron complex outermembrane receptor protein